MLISATGNKRALNANGFTLVDGVPQDPAVRAVAMCGIEGWRDVGDERLPTAMPDAVEIVATIKGVGDVGQLFLIGLGR